jgi:hypothetical protein
VRIHVEVTADDIARGLPENSESCPIAVALRRAADGVEVLVFNTFYSARGERRSLPEAVRLFVHRFDSGRAVRLRPGPPRPCTRGGRRMSEPYWPEGALEWLDFLESTCERCRHYRDRTEARDIRCARGINLYALDLDTGEDVRPPEWIHGPDGPTCTAFGRRADA